MCGVLALRAFRADTDLRVPFQRALSNLAHRGPDGEGQMNPEQEPLTLMGHRRLAIFDPQDRAGQPMRCPMTGNVLIFNGAIYNFKALRQALQDAGCSFTTEGDTEVLLQGWRIWGEGLFARCNGMWALVIWDAASGDLVYCRDRLGVKPLYVHRDGNLALLASEISAIAAFLGRYPAPNPEKLFDFLITGFSEQTLATFYQGIQAVPPGQVCRLSRHGRLAMRPYHQWPSANSRAVLTDEALRELIEDAIRLRLQADVPVASLLSGGLDSSIITRLALDASSSPFQRLEGVFTYAYQSQEHQAFDESAKATALLRESGHQDLHRILRFSPIPAADELMNLVAVQGEPFATLSALAGFRTYRAIAAQGFKVVMGGEGADELFGGYIARYHSLAVRDSLRHGQVSQAIRLLRHRTFDAGLVLNRLVWELPSSWVGSLLRRRRPSVAAISETLWHDQRHRLTAIGENMRLGLEARLRDDELHTLLPKVLRMADRNSMNAGIELRSPFMDHRLVEHLLATPALSRVGEQNSKILLRKAFQTQLPTSLIAARKDTGFGHAEQYLLNQLPWRDLLADLPAGLDEFLDVARLRQSLSTHRGDQSTLWLALSVALWYRHIYG